MYRVCYPLFVKVYVTSLIAKTTLKRPEWLGRVSMDHLLHTSQKMYTFSDVSVANCYLHQ